MIDEYLNTKYSGDRAERRPDLLLSVNNNKVYTLIELKRPSVTIGRDAESQALKYRDDLNVYFHGKKIEIIVVGGRVNPIISSHNERPDVQLIAYTELVSNARSQLEWLLNELRNE